MNERTIIYIPHGGGPMPLMGNPNDALMVEFLERFGETTARPSAILVISAHWEAAQPTVMNSDAPKLLYDYSGFPPETYEIEYPAPGEPYLAQAIYDRLEVSGFSPSFESKRGLDHGVFVPLKLMYPDADIPVVQLSLMRGLDPATHIEMGKALAGLDWPGLLVVGSGMSFHNLRAMMAPPADLVDQSDEFHGWLHQVLTDPALSFEDRASRLIDWEAAPSARFCHPREEHLVPLHVCFGMTFRAPQAATIAFYDRVMRTRVSALAWKEQ